MLGLPAETVLTGWDFSTGGVKCLAFDLEGRTLAEVRLETDLWTDGGVNELNLCQLEGQALASTRVIADRLRELKRLSHWLAGGISATHHTAGRIDRDRLQVRRAICWNDHSLAAYHERGLQRLGGQPKVIDLVGGPWAIRYSLSHLVKDEECLDGDGWRRTWRILPHGSLAAGYLTGNFDTCSVSSAASTGIMHLGDRVWCRAMLDALENAEYRKLAWEQLPPIVDSNEPVGRLSAGMRAAAGLQGEGPIVFPTSDDQQAGLVGGGAVDPGQVAVILGNSAVVNSSSERPPASGSLDVMRLNWGPYLWMRCYNNGAQFLDRIVGKKPNWTALEAAGVATPAGCAGVAVLPFAFPEPSLGVKKERIEWTREPSEPGVRFRASLEALAYLIKWGVREHVQAGQQIERISVSGGIARSDLMCEILASVLEKELHRLESFEGPALGAAVTALSALETNRRKAAGVKEPYRVADAVAKMVKFRQVVRPRDEWREDYRRGFAAFEARLK